MSEDLTRWRLCEISDGGHFFLHDAEGNDLDKIETKLKELKDKVYEYVYIYVYMLMMDICPRQTDFE